MKKSVLAASVAIALFAAPAIAFAGDLNRESTRFPDGSQLIVVTTKQGGLASPGATTVTRMLCSAPPTVKCTMVGSDAFSQDGIFAGLPGDIVRAVGLKEFGRALRPATSDTTNYNSNYSETGVGVTTDDGDVNTNNSGNSYDFGDEDDGKG